MNKEKLQKQFEKDFEKMRIRELLKEEGYLQREKLKKEILKKLPEQENYPKDEDDKREFGFAVGYNKCLVEVQKIIKNI